MNPMDLTARDLAALVRGGLSPVEVAEAALVRVCARNPALNALVHVDPARVRAEAAGVARRLAAGDDLPLAGVPVVIKDNIWVSGMPITQGSALFAGFIAPEDARAVTLLRQAGAVVLGIGACSDLACLGVTTTLLHGATCHPLDPALTPGGSSGGPVVAVAAGMAPLALGTDAGGSSRRPPAHVGVVGFKPTQDLIPYGPGFAEPFWGISVLAPIARDVEDTALLVSVLAPVGSGSDPWLGDADEIAGLRLAFSAGMGLDLPLDAGVEAAIRRAIAALRAAGFAISDDSPDWPDGATQPGVMPLQAAGLSMLHGARWQTDPGLFDPDIGRQIKLGFGLSGTDVARALENSRLMRDCLRDFLGRHDLLLTPTSSALAWPHDRLGPATIGGMPAGPRDHAAFTPQYNHAGAPAISIPCGVAPNGLPVGLQIGAAPGRDALLLSAAQAIQSTLARSALWPAT